MVYIVVFLFAAFQAVDRFKLASCARIAAYPMMGGSQYMIMRNIGLELADRGHEFVIIASSTHSIQPSDKIKHRVYQVPYTHSYIQNELILKGAMTGFFNAVSQLRTVLKTFCESTLNETSIQEEFKDFDIILTDTTMPCGVLLAQWFDVPWVEICPAGSQFPTLHNYNVPSPVSYIPVMKSGNTGRMTFLQRVKNVIMSVIVHYFVGDYVMLKPFNDLKMKYNIKPGQSIYKAIGDAEMVLFTADFALEYAQPMLPSTKMVGAMNIKKAKPLSGELEEFMASSGEHGVLLVTFGTNVAALEKTKVDMLAEAFGKLKQKVIWRMQGYTPSPLSPNIKIMQWLPQTDLLAHKKLKAFMTHAGHNSLYESAYFGVPMVMMPLFAEQPDNALKGEYHGLGLVVDHTTVTADQLHRTIETVIREPRFKAAAVRISNIMSDRARTPQEESADWIEYVIRHGGARHLRPEVFNLTWYQYYLVDVAAFLAGILFAVVMVTRLVCMCLCGLCCKRTSKSKKD